MKRTRTKDLLLNPVISAVYAVILFVLCALVEPTWLSLLLTLMSIGSLGALILDYWGGDGNGKEDH